MSADERKDGTVYRHELAEEELEEIRPLVKEVFSIMLELMLKSFPGGYVRSSILLD
jgi:hypothetical protein